MKIRNKSIFIIYSRQLKKYFHFINLLIKKFQGEMMEHSLEFISQFSSINQETAKHKRLNSIHYDSSGHVVATNSHILFASKQPFEIHKANKSYFFNDELKEFSIESEMGYPEWKKILPRKCLHKINIDIPEWFQELDKIDFNVTIVIDYNDKQDPYIKLSQTTEDMSAAINAKYLKNFAGQEVSMFIDAPDKQILILSKHTDLRPLSDNLDEKILEEEWFSVLMPIKLDHENREQKAYF